MEFKGTYIKNPIYNSPSIKDADENDNSLLIHAIQNQYEDEAKLLIEKGVHINTQNENGETALMYAVKCSSEGIVKLLLNQGAHINTQNKYGETALMKAIKYSSKDNVKLLLKKAQILIHNIYVYIKRMP